MELSNRRKDAIRAQIERRLEGLKKLPPGSTAAVDDKIKRTIAMLEQKLSGEVAAPDQIAAQAAVAVSGAGRPPKTSPVPVPAPDYRALIGSLTGAVPVLPKPSAAAPAVVPELRGAERMIASMKADFAAYPDRSPMATTLRALNAQTRQPAPVASGGTISLETLKSVMVAVTNQYSLAGILRGVSDDVTAGERLRKELWCMGLSVPNLDLDTEARAKNWFRVEATKGINRVTRAYHQQTVDGFFARGN